MFFFCISDYLYLHWERYDPKLPVKLLLKRHRFQNACQNVIVTRLNPVKHFPLFIQYVLSFNTTFLWDIIEKIIIRISLVKYIHFYKGSMYTLDMKNIETQLTTKRYNASIDFCVFLVNKICSGYNSIISVKPRHNSLKFD